MGRVDPSIQARRALVADARSLLARTLDGSGLTTAEQVMVLGELVAGYAGAAVKAEREKPPDAAESDPARVGG